MKSAVLAVCLATVAMPAFAQTTTTPNATTTTTPASPTAGGPFYTVQPPASGQMAMSNLASDLEDYDV